MRSLRSLAFVLALALGLALVRAAAAGTPTEQLRERIDRAVGILEDGSLRADPPARRAALRTVAGEIFDFAEITRRALGPHWQKATPGEQQELVQLLTVQMERAYMGRIEQYSGERISWVGESVEGDLATVRTHFLTRTGTPIPDYNYDIMGGLDASLAYDIDIAQPRGQRIVNLTYGHRRRVQRLRIGDTAWK